MGAQEGEAASPQTNAAVLYREAGKGLDAGSVRVRELRMKLKAGDSAALTVEEWEWVRAELAKEQERFVLVARATSIPDFDWEVDVSKGFAASLSHLGEMMRLLDYLALRAEVTLLDGAPDEALGDLRAALLLAQRAGEKPSCLIAGLVAMSMEVVMTELLFEHFGAFSHEERLALLAAMESVPDLQATLQGEMALGLQTFRLAIEAAEGQEEMILPGHTASCTLPEAREMVDRYEKEMRVLHGQAGLKDPERMVKIKEWLKQHEADPEKAGINDQSVSAFRWVIQQFYKTSARRAALRVGCRIWEDREALPKKVEDVATGLVFRCEVIGDGVRLTLEKPFGLEENEGPMKWWLR